MVQWTAELDRKLFYGVILHKQLTFGNADHQALAKMMGEGCTAGAIRNRLGALKTSLSRDGLDAATGGSNSKVEASRLKRKSSLEANSTTTSKPLPKSNQASKKEQNAGASGDGACTLRAGGNGQRLRKRRADEAFDEDDSTTSVKEKIVKTEPREEAAPLDDTASGILNYEFSGDEF